MHSFLVYWKVKQTINALRFRLFDFVRHGLLYICSKSLFLLAICCFCWAVFKTSAVFVCLGSFFFGSKNKVKQKTVKSVFSLECTWIGQRMKKEKRVTPVKKPRCHTQTHRLRHFYAEICTTKLATTMIEKKRQQKGILSLTIVNHKSGEQKRFVCLFCFVFFILNR